MVDLATPLSIHPSINQSVSLWPQQRTQIHWIRLRHPTYLYGNIYRSISTILKADDFQIGFLDQVKQQQELRQTEEEEEERVKPFCSQGGHPVPVATSRHRHASQAAATISDFSPRCSVAATLPIPQLFSSLRSTQNRVFIFSALNECATVICR